MRNTVFISAAALLLFLMPLSCSQEDAEETQRKTIENYLGNTYQAIDGIYFKRLRHPLCDTMTVSGSDTALWGECPTVTGETTVLFAYTGRIFKGIVFVTSDTAEAAAAGIYPQPWQEHKAGQGALVEGVRRALRLMTAGDSVHIVFPFTLGYGRTNYVGVVPPMSAQEWIITVKNIK